MQFRDLFFLLMLREDVPVLHLESLSKKKPRSIFFLINMFKIIKKPTMLERELAKDGLR